MRLALRILLAVLLTALPSAALAAKRAALVFSAARYESLRPLANPRNDAAAIAETLETLGFDVSIETDRALSRMRRALDDFREDAAGAEVALVYFAGHGVEIAGENLLLPVDADATSLEKLKASSLALEDIRAIAASVAPVALVILDACRDDPFGTGSGGGRSAKPIGADVRKALRPGLGRIGRSENTLYAFAAAPGETASDGTDGHSPFSAALARYLSTDGLEFRSVLTLVQQEVYERTGGRQLPYVESGLPKLFFAARTGDLPERERLLLAMAEVTPDLRDEVERVAAQNAMPLGPLFGALIGADLKSLTLEHRQKSLAEAAAAFVETRDALRRLASDDPAVSRLRDDAEKNLALGAFDDARAKLAEAAAIDARSAGALAANLVKRRLSEAATHVADAGVAHAQLAHGEAIAAYERAAELHRMIEAEQVADADRRERDWVLAAIGGLHEITGDTARALDAYERMRDAALLRAEKAPGEADAVRDVSISLAKIGDVRSARGDLVGALAAYEQDMALAKGLAARQPDDPEMQRDLSVSLDRIGEARETQGDLDGALASYAEAAAIRERLVASHPRNADLRRDLTVSLNSIGVVRAAMGDLASALDAYRRSLAMVETLVEQDPDNAGLQRDLAIGYDRIGDLGRRLGEPNAALEAHESARAIRSALVARDAGNVLWLRDLSVSHNLIGDAQTALGESRNAFESFRAGLAIREKLAARDPGNADWQRDLAQSHDRIGDAQRALGDNDAALKAYDTSLSISRRLVSLDSRNAGRQRDVSATLNKIGDSLLSVGDREAAAAAYREALAIRTTLASVSPGNADGMRDLLIANVKLAQAGDDPRARYGEALRIAEDMARRGVLARTDAWMIEELRKRKSGAR